MIKDRNDPNNDNIGENNTEMEEKLRKDELTKWIIAIFSANNCSPIKGKMLLTKLVFLLVHEIEPKIAKDFDFFPYQYGPYSTELAKRVNRLLDVGWLVSNKKGSSWEFTLSDSGKELADDFIADLDITEDKINKINELKAENIKLPMKKLLKRIYNEYPEFGIDSRISGV